ncbi:MAG: hypothetical protein CM15mP42_08930 [Methanobacteriota archaeon]|nr:MAG: hypothetical protein CM15mP42_08930 [Euryarchaeota archaeon]
MFPPISSTVQFVGVWFTYHNHGTASVCLAITGPNPNQIEGKNKAEKPKI